MYLPSTSTVYCRPKLVDGMVLINCNSASSGWLEWAYHKMNMKVRKGLEWAYHKMNIKVRKWLEGADHKMN